MQILRTSLVAIGIAAILLSGQSCSRETQQRSVAVAPPFQDVQVAFNTYEIDPAAGGEIKLENGTRIIVPANAFVDANGQAVMEKVQLRYREFHSTADIMASGIPLCYDSAGQTHNFESAGMFEIGGSCNGAPVQIAQGKDLQVQMASFKAGNDFNFYYYDPAVNNWDYKDQVAATPNTEKEKALTALPELPVKPARLAELDKKSCVVDLDVNYALYPELRPLEGVVWQYAGNEPGKTPCNDKAFAANNWTDMELVRAEGEEFVYDLTLKSRDREYKTRIKPVLDAAQMAQAKADLKKKIEAYNQVLEAQKLEQERLAAQADLLRSFSVARFGIYNWDRIMKDKEVIPMAADFEFDRYVDKSKTTIFLVSSDDKLVTYYPESWDKFSFDPSTKNALIAVMPGDRLAVCGPEGFKELEAESARRKGKHTFKLKTTGKKITSVDELEKTLKEII